MATEIDVDIQGISIMRNRFLQNMGRFLREHWIAMAAVLLGLVALAVVLLFLPAGILTITALLINFSFPLFGTVVAPFVFLAGLSTAAATTIVALGVFAAFTTVSAIVINVGNIIYTLFSDNFALSPYKKLDGSSPSTNDEKRESETKKPMSDDEKHKSDEEGKHDGFSIGRDPSKKKSSGDDNTSADDRTSEISSTPEDEPSSNTHGVS